VGTGDEVERIIAQADPGVTFAVASNPEFLREGAAIGDFKRPDRIVIGSDDDWARSVMREVYRPLFLNRAPILFTSRRSAELIKYAANAFLATKITFINEIADLCERVGANVQDVAKGMGLDGRIGKKFLHPGPGYGGSCFPKDTLALARIGADHASPVRLVETVIDINNKRKHAMADRVLAMCGGSVAGRTVAVLGVTFKPDTDDMRDAPSLDIIPILQAAGAAIQAYDPAGMHEAAQLLPGVAWKTDAYDAAKDADVLVIITEWNEFRALQLERLAEIMKRPAIVDLRNVYNPVDAVNAGFAYSSIGRPEARPATH
jgi:UDPglucose 6-dehydrogenase